MSPAAAVLSRGLPPSRHCVDTGEACGETGDTSLSSCKSPFLLSPYFFCFFRAHVPPGHAPAAQLCFQCSPCAQLFTPNLPALPPHPYVPSTHSLGLCRLLFCFLLVMLLLFLLVQHNISGTPQVIFHKFAMDVHLNWKMFNVNRHKH